MARIDELLRLNQQGASSAPLPPWLNPNSPGIPTPPDPLGIGRPASMPGTPSQGSEAPQDPRDQLAMLLAQGPNAQASGAPQQGAGSATDVDALMQMLQGGQGQGALSDRDLQGMQGQGQGALSDFDMERLRRAGMRR